MRGFSKISARFWTGRTGKSMRGQLEAQLVAMYLLTAPTKNMAGLYYLPIPTIAHELGLSEEGASKALRRVCETGFAAYDESDEVVWVPNMAREQIGAELKPNDKRSAGLVSVLEPYKGHAFIRLFVDLYRERYAIPPEVLRWGSDAPSMPPRSQKQYQQQKQQQKQEQKELPPGGGAHPAFIAVFDSLYAEANGGAKPTWGAKQGAQVKALLKAHGADECSQRAANMFRAPPPWPARPHDLATLVQHFDKFAQPYRPPDRARDLWELADRMEAEEAAEP